MSDPHAASSGAARHGRLSAASTAPGADIPCATSARAPGQYCQSAALRAPGHGRPLAITAGVLCRDRLSAALLAPGAVVSPAATAEAPRQHRLSAAPIATVSLPAGPHRLRQEGLPHTPANPRTLIYPHTHHTAHTRTMYRRATRYVQSRARANHPSPNVGEGPGVRPYPPPPPIKCILSSKYRPTRGLAPPRTRASRSTTPPAPRRRVIAAQAAIHPAGCQSGRGVPCGRPSPAPPFSFPGGRRPGVRPNAPRRRRLRLVARLPRLPTVANEPNPRVLQRERHPRPAAPV